ncbi:MAG: peptidoglycan binding protein CsiV [Gammaproteobacteria bacterium]|nr:peptidoglycan binding protein CsiV [Gammaproteobacteria bacterium]
MYKIISLIFILSICFNLVSAEEIPQYDIEIILFEHKNNTSIDSEVWPLSPEMPATEGSVSLHRPNAAVYSGSHNNVSGTTPINLTLLTPSDYQMSENIQKLMTSESYNPLFHVAWRQNVYGNDDAQAIHITTDRLHPVAAENETTEQQAKNATIDGTIVVSLKRFLHLKADLAYINLDGSNFFSDTETPVVFRMTESRRMRSKEVHYFDHPKFGMLALITPYEPPPAPVPAPKAMPATQAPVTKTP